MLRLDKKKERNKNPINDRSQTCCCTARRKKKKKKKKKNGKVKHGLLTKINGNK